MNNFSDTNQLTKKERRELKRKRKEEKRLLEGKRMFAAKKRSTALIAVLVVFVLAGLGWIITSSPTVKSEDILSQNGLHWHSELAIYINGERQNIPANIGIGAVHNPIHTHDDKDLIHMELEGRLVTKDDVMLGKFFKVWGKQFNENCIFDNCAQGEKKVKMLVNGTENALYDKYVMQDKDKIVIRYE